MPRRFATLDVFTTTPLAGNPLAVVLDGQGLSDARMQAIAGEFNLSETVFVLPPEDARNRAGLRIFTPARELPFAGHPTVGTAALLALQDHGGRHGHVAFDLEERVGVVPCAVEVLNVDTARASFTVPRASLRVGDLPDNGLIARALGLAPEDVGADDHAPAVWSAGVPFGLVPLRSRAALDAIRIDREAFDRAFAGAAEGHCFAWTPDGEGGEIAVHARMFAPTMGIAEDPATGGAVAAFSGAWVAAARPGDGDHALAIEQGRRMGRPSRIDLSVSVVDGAVTRAAIGGGAVVIATGVIHV